MAKILLVRHGYTKLNSAERFWGQTDIELSAEGIRQAEQLSDRLAKQKIDAIYTSNLKRAIVTAEIVASKRKVDIVICPELVEINFGYAEGLTFEEISKSYPDLAKSMADWRTRPKFPGGESMDELNERVIKFLPRLENHKPKETVLIVAHAGILRLLICNLMGIERKHWRQMRTDLGSLSILETYPQGAILSLLNDISHLK